MRLKKTNRRFKVSHGHHTECARINLAPGEVVTFTTQGGAEHDVTRMPWGFYATSSMNHRLVNFGLRSALVRTPEPRYMIVLVEAGKEDAFYEDMKKSNYSVLTWFTEWA